MSLESTPTTGRHDRPPPPSRSKRSSAQARTGTSTPTQGLGLGLDLNDEDLGRASKGDLEDALKERWLANEKLQERILELEERVRVLDGEKEGTGWGLGAIQERCEEACREQTRLEMDVEARDDLLDRLRSRLAMLERELRESQRIAQVQERAFESERTSLQAQEAHLNSRIRQLQNTTKLVAPSSSPSETLQEDLDSLRSSHSTLLGQLNRLSNEVQELRGENGRLKEENEGWEYLVREQTFSNRLFQREEKEDEGERYTKSQLDVLDEEMDEEMDHLHSELEAQSPTDEIFPRSTPMSRQPSSRMGRNISGPSMYSEGGMSRNTSGISSMYTEEPIEGMDLAAELGRAEYGPVILDAVGEEMNVEKENKRLREEVKALQLYCSKIIDRIIAQDGFEHILNVDYKTKRVGRAGNRGSLLEVVKIMHGDVAPAPAVPVVEPAAVKARPVSMVRGNSAGETKVEEDKSTKRARRGFSLDLRTFGFKSPTFTPEPKPLRPLQLVPSPPMTSGSLARKLDPHPEDEDDRRERSRLEAALKLMGIDKSSHPSPSPMPAPTTGQSVKRSSSIKSSGTPLSRLPSALGFSDQLPPDPDPSPEKVDAALKEYDVKEQARRLSLSTGKEGGGYTSPPRVTRRITDTDVVRRSGSGSISTLWSVNDTPSPDTSRR